MSEDRYPEMPEDDGYGFIPWVVGGICVLFVVLFFTIGM